MSSLREIRTRIGSVRSTLKITSAMKLVASSKLRKAQRSIESLRPYEAALTDTMSALLSGSSLLSSVCVEGSSPMGSEESRGVMGEGTAFSRPVATRGHVSGGTANEVGGGMSEAKVTEKAVAFDIKAAATAVVVISSNSSLCGGFNANVIRKAMETLKSIEGEKKLFAIGRKAADAMKREGYPSEVDYSDIIGHPSFDKSTALSDALVRRFISGEFSRVILVYNHFVTASTQTQVVEQYLPFVPSVKCDASANVMEDIILEPSRDELLSSLLPQVITLKFHAAVLDSSAAEHAARTVAMQTATDNANELLSDLTLEYNKGRQQKITSEILDLVGGSIQ